MSFNSKLDFSIQMIMYVMLFVLMFLNRVLMEPHMVKQSHIRAWLVEEIKHRFTLCLTRSSCRTSGVGVKLCSASNNCRTSGYSDALGTNPTHYSTDQGDALWAPPQKTTSATRGDLVGRRLIGR